MSRKYKTGSVESNCIEKTEYPVHFRRLAWAYFSSSFIWRKSFESSFSTVPLPLAWQPAYLYTLLLLVFFFLLKALLNELLKFLRQHWKHLSGQSTAWLTEGIKKINCCGLKEIKLHVSVKESGRCKVPAALWGSLQFAGALTHLTHAQAFQLGEHIFSLSVPRRILPEWVNCFSAKSSL